MSTDGKTILTDAGELAIQDAIASDSLVAITHVALGDGGGARYDPPFTATGLRGERIRLPIVSQSQTADAVWIVRAEFPEGPTPDFRVREVGYYDAQGRLIALWAGAEIADRDTHGLDLLVDFTLVLTRVAEGVVIVDADDDALLALAASTGAAIANLQLEQLRQADRIRSMENSR